MTTTKKAPRRERHAPTKAKRTRQGSQQTNESKATTPQAKCLDWPPTVQAIGLPLPGARKLLQDALAWLEVEDARTSLENNVHRMTEGDIASRALVITSPDAPSADLESAWAGDIAVDLPTRNELRARLARYSLPMPEGGPLDVLEGQAFEELPPARQAATLAYALYDLRRYRSDLTPGELDWLRSHLPPGPVRVDQLDQEQRARVAGAVLLVLRRRAGWAA